MSENAEATTSPQLTLFAEDSLASLTVSPGSKRARQMTVTSGRNIAALLDSSDPVGLLVKTCLESETLCSTRCYLTWKVWTTPLGRLLFRLAPSTPRTEGSGSGLWPTPNTKDGTIGGTIDESEIRTTGGLPRRMSGGKDGYALTLARYAKLYPTPLPSDVMGGRTTKGKHRQNETGLRKVAQMWPTPRSNSAMAATITEKADADRYPNLETVLKKRDPAVVGGSLNPPWVEWLQGFQLDWTEVT